MNGADIRAGSNPRALNKKGNDAPATDARTEMANRLTPTETDTASG